MLSEFNYEQQFINPWHEEKGEQLAENLWAYLRSLTSSQSYRRLNDQRHRRLYSRVDAMLGDGFRGNEGVLKFNVVQSCIDSILSEFAQNKPRVTCLTSDGDWTLRRKGKQLTEYLDGAFYDSNVYQKARDVLFDALVFDAGHLYPYWDAQTERVECEFVPNGEVVLDDIAATRAAPREIYRVRWVPRASLYADFPEKEHEIKNANGKVFTNENEIFRYTDLVCVVEAWRYAIGCPDDDWYVPGKHVITVENCTLFDEEYAIDGNPFMVFRWSLRSRGYWGRGVSELLLGAQYEINTVLMKMQDALNLASPHIFVKPGSLVNAAHLTNGIWSVIECTEAPVFSPTLSIPPDLVRHLDAVINRAYQECGVSQMAAAALKPSGLSSGLALQEYSDSVSKRFLDASSRWEQLFVNLGLRYIELTRLAYNENKKLSIRTRTKNGLSRINWRDVDMEADAYALQAFPTSFFPTTPAGRLQRISILMENGMVSREQAMSLLDFPDLQSVSSFATAPYDLISMQIEQIFDKEEQATPYPEQPLDLCLSMMTTALQRAIINGAGEEALERARIYLSQCAALINASEASQPPPEAMGMPPLPEGMPPPPEGVPPELLQASNDTAAQAGGVPPMPPPTF